MISPKIDYEVTKDLERLKFLTVITDTSNHKALKMLPVLVRGFSEEKGVQVFKLQVKLIPNEKSETIGKEIVETGSTRKIVDKIVAFAADNCAINYGSFDRNGENNVFYRLKQLLGRKIAGVGCSSHIIHNAFKAGCEILEIQIEPLVVVIYNHFKLHTTRNESLKQFCEDEYINHTTLQKHSGTRFLTLHGAIIKVSSRNCA